MTRIDWAKEFEQAKMDGARARWDGLALEDNPYGYGSPKSKKAWDDGWQRHAELIPPLTSDPSGGNLPE